MKKEIAIGFMALAMVSAVFAKKDKGIDWVIIDYQGRSLGVEKPKWVEAASNGNKKVVRQEFGLADDTVIFVVTENGENLDFLKTWADQVNIREQVASSIETTIANVVRASFKGNNSESEKKVEKYSAQVTNITLNGLQKISDYWTKERSLKTGVKKAQSDEDYNYQVVYYVVFAIDGKLFKQQLDAAMNDVDDSDDQSGVFREMLTTKCHEILSNGDSN